MTSRCSLLLSLAHGNFAQIIDQLIAVLRRHDGSGAGKAGWLRDRARRRGQLARDARVEILDVGQEARIVHGDLLEAGADFGERALNSALRLLDLLLA